MSLNDWVTLVARWGVFLLAWPALVDAVRAHKSNGLITRTLVEVFVLFIWSMGWYGVYQALLFTGWAPSTRAFLREHGGWFVWLPFLVVMLRFHVARRWAVGETLEPVGDLLARRPAPAPVAPSGAPVVLVVDDNATDRRVITAALSGEFVVHEADSAMAGLAFLQHVLPDIVLVDLRMPRVGGAELVSSIRSVPGLRDTPLIAHTAHGPAAARAAGCDGHIGKPADTRTLPAVMRAFIVAGPLR